MTRAESTGMREGRGRSPRRGPAPRAARPFCVLTSAFCLLAAAGCAPRSELRLLQPSAPPAQRNLTLASDWAWYLDEGGRRFVLLAYPLPGARDGPRDFLVFLSAPEDDGELTVDPDDPSAVRGFLIQVVGQLRGKTLFRSGSLSVRRRFLERARRELTLDLQCADGTQLTGRALIDPDPRELRAFQRRFAGDVQKLAPPETQPASSEPAELPAETAERPQVPPGQP